MYKLTFASVVIIDSNTVEVMFNSGIEITLEMVDEFFSFINKHCQGKISVVLNKATKYSYKFDALVKLSLSESIQNIAVIAYDQTSASMSEFMKKRFNKSDKSIEIFNTREQALEWLASISKQITD